MKKKIYILSISYLCTLYAAIENQAVKNPSKQEEIFVRSELRYPTFQELLDKKLISLPKKPTDLELAIAQQEVYSLIKKEFNLIQNYYKNRITQESHRYLLQELAKIKNLSPYTRQKQQFLRELANIQEVA